MKKNLGIIVLGLLLSGCATAPTVNDLVGKKILCGEWSTDNKVLITKLPIDAYDFVTENSVTYYTISETSDPRIGFSRDFFKYKLIYDEILIKMNNSSEHNLNRSTGSRRIGYSNSTDVICRPLNDKKNIRKMFNKIHKLRLEKLKF
jgi:hypothetical protein|tara:strand:- start:39 stop:479 length:441 start_codon:yes stop_codon:yes gene_type:complete